jgi:N-acetylmuramoyl-L-alanine amidase
VPEARGATIYTLSEVASDREAARMAARENRSDFLLAGMSFAGSADVADILFDLTQRETMNASAEFANVMQREMQPYVRFKSNAHRFAGFRVLKAPDMPSVLLETGYLSNLEDSKFVFSEAGQKAIAKGVAKAVDAHLNRRIASR